MAMSELVGKGLYSAREAAHIIRVPVNKLRRWMFGYQSKGVEYKGLWEREIREPDVIK